MRWLSKSLFVPASMFLLVGVIFANAVVASTVLSTAIQSSGAFGQALANMTVLIVQRVGSGLLLTGTLTGVIALVLFMFSWRTDTNERSAVKMVQVQYH